MFLTGLEMLTEKVAARRGLKEIRKMVTGGNIGGANRLAITPGVLKKTRGGSQVKNLGKGMEGVSTLTAHPKRGLEVEKIIDPKGIMAGDSSRSVAPAIRRREWLQQEMKGSPDVAAFYGSRKTPSGLHAQRFEYVPGGAVPSDPFAAGGGGEAAQKNKQRVDAQLKRLKRTGARAGTDVIDLHSGNVKTPAGGKGGKAVDLMALPLDTASRRVPSGVNAENLEKGMAAQAAGSEGLRTPYLDYLGDPRRAGNLRAQAYRSAPPLVPGTSTALRERRPQAFGLPKGSQQQMASSGDTLLPKGQLPAASTRVLKPPVRPAIRV